MPEARQLRQRLLPWVPCGQITVVVAKLICGLGRLNGMVKLACCRVKEDKLYLTKIANMRYYYDLLFEEHSLHVLYNEEKVIYIVDITIA